MTAPTSDPRTAEPSAPAPEARRRPRPKKRTSLLSHGQPMMWLLGGSLVICLTMIVGLLLLVFLQGAATFWPGPLIEVRTVGGATYLGDVVREEDYRPADEVFDALPEGAREKARETVAKQRGWSRRRLLRTANFDLTQSHHHWVSDFEVVEESRPEWALVIERATNDGPFLGFPKAFLVDGKASATDPAGAWAELNRYQAAVAQRVRRRGRIEKDEIGAVNRKEEAARLALHQTEVDHGKDSPAYAAAEKKLEEVAAWAAPEHARLNAEIAALNEENNRYQLVLTAADGREKVLPVAEVMRAFPANQLGFVGKLGIYLSRWWEFVSDDPRNINSEGGVFPAIWGTAAMTILMSLAVVPFGVLAALYLREYAKAGLAVSAVRIAINNLAGVPSIVFGVFGVGFFCYFIGASVDELFFRAKLPNATFGTPGLLWASLTLALLTLPVVIVATEEALAAVPRSMREGSYACGASKWQTIRRIVLPRAMPGILTGLILAMARGAGEVAPLMLVGAVKWTSKLPVDNVFPYVHPERSFMHLGFHIYDVGFQSQDSESAKPMVFTTTLLLIVLIATLNLAAMWLRMRLRRRYVGNQF
jgi:phosphate transport system permease protein